MFDEVEVWHRKTPHFLGVDEIKGRRLRAHLSREAHDEWGCTYIAWCLNSPTHHDDLFDLQERLRVFGSCNSEVSQRANSYNGHRVWLILRQDLQHLLVSGFQRRDEQRVSILDGLECRNFFGRQVVRGGLEERLPCLFWR